MRVLLDTNVLVSALITKDTPPDQIFRAWRNHAFELVSSEGQLLELERVLVYPKLKPFIRETEIPLLLQGLRNGAILATVSHIKPFCADAADNAIIAAALAGNAQYLVTGDKRHILSLNVASLRIVTPASFLEEVMR